jgi:D-sedoheptulose 7-phosphate isomerase
MLEDQTGYSLSAVVPVRLFQMNHLIEEYSSKLGHALASPGMAEVPQLAALLLRAWRTGASVYLCGNGGSAGNAIHLANDFIYGVSKRDGIGLRVEALSANSAVLTCLANDTGYDNVYAQQIKVKGQPGDLLIALSGSGNSPNIVNALKAARENGLTSVAILGFGGGQCLTLADVPIHIPIDDMQIAEDMQLIIGHMCMQYLCNHQGHA